MIKNITIGILLLALGATAATLIIKKPADVVVKTSTETPTNTEPTYSWTFKNKGEKKDTGAPLTEVSLTAGGSTRVIGTYEGSCSVIDNKSWKLLPGEKTGVICWFAGGGSEIGVFEESGSVVVKVGSVDEGDAETAGTRGSFKTVISL